MKAEEKVKVKVKVTLVQALRLCTGRTAHRGSRGITLNLSWPRHYKGWGVSITPRPLFTPGIDPVPIVQENGWAPGPVWTGAENLAPTGIRSPDRPARSQFYSNCNTRLQSWRGNTQNGLCKSDITKNVCSCNKPHLCSLQSAWRH